MTAGTKEFLDGLTIIDVATTDEATVWTARSPKPADGPNVVLLADVRFEFDPAKSAANLAKRGIDFEDAQALWDDQDYLGQASTTSRGVNL